MKRTHQIGVITLGWLFGLVLASQFATNIHGYWLIVILLIGGMSFKWVNSRLLLLVLLSLALIGGLVRGQLYFSQLENSVAARDYIGSKVVLSGRVVDAPRWNSERLNEFYVGELRESGNSVDGLLKVKSLIGNVAEGQQVRVQGKVGRALGRAEAQIWYADVAVVNPTPPLPVRVKRLMVEGMARVLPTDMAAFAQGLVFGGSTGLSDYMQTATRAAGLTHIVAVSGYNLTIIMLLVLAFWRRRHLGSVVLALGLMVFFVVMTGASASVVRAAVMTSLILLIGSTRRQLDVRMALALTVILMTAWSPRFLYADLSWQLSVLALAGVLFLAPVFMPKNLKRHKLVWELFAVSLAAHLATAPLIAYVFGGFSLIAPFANIIVLPLIPLCMLAAFMAGVVGIFAPTSVLWLALPLQWLLQTVMRLIMTFGSLPYAQANVRFDMAALVAGYVGVALVIGLSLRRSSKNRFQQV